jgi:hypothetical protein
MFKKRKPPQMSHTELAARLLVDASLDIIAGRPAKPLPVEGAPLSQANRAKLGKPAGGRTMYYSLGKDTGVFMDFSDNETTIWFKGADSLDARRKVEEALSAAYPDYVLRSDQANPQNTNMRHRAYDVPLGNGRIATVDIAYPGPGSIPRGFTARVVAYQVKPNT